MTSEWVRDQLVEMDKLAKYPSGLVRIEKGECPMGGTSAMSCMFCGCGHMLECHHPMSCDEAQCSHVVQG